MRRMIGSLGLGLALATAWLGGPAASARDRPPTDNNLVYHIFVRSWADANGDGDEIGDLRGLRAKLDYLNDGKPETDDDLEVGILWLMPVFPSPSYHGYDVTDYRAIHPEYGSLQDFKDLVAEAHARGLRIMLDLPVNHTSNRHPWFREAVNDPDSRFRKFYHFAPIDQPAPPGPWHVATADDGSKVRYLGLFSPVMPDLDFRNPEVRAEALAIAKFWLDLGADGFRLDAAKHLFGDTFGTIPEPDILANNDFWRDFSDAAYRINPDAVLVGEVLGGEESLRRHAYGLDALIDEPFMNDARGRIAFAGAGFLGRHRDFVERCREVNHQAHVGPGALPRSEPFQPYLFLSSHDQTPRLASYLADMKARGMPAEVDEAYRVGMYLLATLSKYAILYYGDELMQPGYKWNGNPPNADPPGDGSRIYDETLREPFPWHKAGDNPADEEDDDFQADWSDQLPRFDRPNDGVSVEEQEQAGGMLDLVRGLTNLRAEHPGLADGELGDILTDSPDWLVFERVSPTARHLVLINPTGTGHDYRFHQGWYPRYLKAKLLFWSDGKQKQWKDESEGDVHIEDKAFVAPYGMVVLEQATP